VKRSSVYLIGAGPGDPSLISVRGYRYLTAADVVVYDHLVHRRLLRAVRPDAEKIDVGAVAPRPLEQDAICFLLAEKAREGKTVARLKWGDPFVFDSGGKEALFLHEQAIPFEVVPGIPPAVGIASYAGVPVTYPGAGDTLILVRGHEHETSAPPHVDWGRIASLGGTVVTYADGPQLERIISALVGHGRSADEPAALVVNGTLPAQRTVQGTLKALLQTVKQMPNGQSAVLVVGRVVALRDHLRWFDERPLFGKRILVTRSREQAGELVDLLAELGADPIEAPTIRIAPPMDYGPLDAACAQVGAFDWVVFTSANGVEHFMQRLLAGPGDVRDLKGVHLCAIGPATSDRLTRYGVKVDLMPVEHRADAIVEALRVREDLAGKRILLPRADLAREVLAAELRRAGSEVVEVTAYRTIAAGSGGDDEVDIYKMLLDRGVDVVTFTSASTVRNFVKLLGTDPAADLLHTTVVASIGPVTAEAAQQFGIETTIMPSTYTVPALVEAIVEYFERQRGEKT
jgi:uroporphyrinogen III methyltransferase/synthase